MSALEYSKDADEVKVRLGIYFPTRSKVLMPMFASLWAGTEKSHPSDWVSRP